MIRPIVFLTHYGLGDELWACVTGHGPHRPGRAVIDLTHAIPREDVMRGGLAGRAVRFMPDDAVYLAVVDPGVGRIAAVAVRAASGRPGRSRQRAAVNGVAGARRRRLGRRDDTRASALSRSPTRSTAATCSRLRRPIWRRPCRWTTRSGRIPVEELHVVEMPGPMVASGAIGARVTGIDGFGNVQLNVGPDDLEAAGHRTHLDRARARGPPGGHLRRPPGGHARGHHRLTGPARARRQPRKWPRWDWPQQTRWCWITGQSRRRNWMIGWEPTP